MAKKPSGQDTVRSSVPPSVAVERPGRRVTRLVRELAAAMDRLDQAAADQLGVGRTDLRGLEVLERLARPMTAGHMAEQLGLTTGAATLLVDRLERAGYVQRRRDTHDRRKIYVDVTSTLQERTARLFSGVGRAAAQLANAYSSEQLQIIEEFIGQLVTVVGTEAGVICQSPDLGGAPGDYHDGDVGMAARP